MSAWYVLCFLSAVSVFLAFANQYFLSTQTTIAITRGSVLLSVLLLFMLKIGVHSPTVDLIENALEDINFNELLLKGMLGFLLFAGGLEINLKLLKSQRWEIAVLALGSTLLSTFLVGYASYWLLGALGYQLPFIYCLLFGALISPTDPIAVLAIIKHMRAPEKIAVQIEGESLFNDGVGLVIFSVIFALAFSGVEPTIERVADIFFVEAVGGILFGGVLAVVAHYMIKKSNDPSIELLITLAIPTSGYACAVMMGISGPLAMVVAGIVIGNITKAQGFSKDSQRSLKHFWHTMDSFLNALLFLLIGLILVVLPVQWMEVWLGLLMIPLVLAARFVSVWLPYLGFKRFRQYDVHSIKILTWGGLRGGLALAMAASTPKHALMVQGVDVHTLLLVMTYIVVIFSILVQAPTISPMIRDSIARQNAKAGSAEDQSA